jgi:hypothetical protein
MTARRGDIVELPPNASSHDRNRAPLVNEALKFLPPKEVRETFEERQARLEGKRIKYAGMKAHQEMAAQVLAAGGTFKQAAHRAGVSVRQVKKYYTEADFRTRIEEMRQVMFSKIRGRVIREMENRTKPGEIENIELLDLLRIFDRMYGPIGGKSGVQIAGDLNVTSNNYDTLVAALLAPQSGAEGGDFPIFEPENLRLPSGSSPE